MLRRRRAKPTVAVLSNCSFFVGAAVLCQALAPPRRVIAEAPSSAFEVLLGSGDVLRRVHSAVQETRVVVRLQKREVAEFCEKLHVNRVEFVNPLIMNGW